MRDHSNPSKDLTHGRHHFLMISLFVCGGVLLGGSAFASDEMGMHEHMSEHEHHHHAMNTEAAVKRSEVDYKVPALNLIRQDGTTAVFPKEIDDGRPVILNFIYTSCTAVCPLTSQVFSRVQKELNEGHMKVHMLSISIDPEYDTPQRLDAYARKYQASAQWQFYTGTIETSVAMQKAFNAYRGDKMNHIPLTFLRAAPGKPWVRLDGFANPDEVVHEFHELVASK